MNPLKLQGFPRAGPALAMTLALAFAAPTFAATPPAAPPTDLADLSLEQLMEIRIEKVFGASKYEQRVTRAPAAVTIVTGDEAAKLGHRTLADVLRSIRGLYVTSDRNYANFGIRGFARPGDFNTRVLLLVDGHRMNDNLYGSALIGTEGMLDLESIDRVEVVRGPSSSIYGNSAFFGVINVITRSGAQIDGLEVAATEGTLGTHQGGFNYGKLFRNGLDLVLSGSLYENAGEPRLYYPRFDTARNNHGVAEDSDGERAKKLSGRATYHDLTFAAGFARRDKHVPTASFGTAFNDGREQTTDGSIFADVKLRHDFTGGAELVARTFYDRYDYRATYPYDITSRAARPTIILNHDASRGEGIGADVQFTTRLHDRHTLVFGAEHRRDLHLRQANFNENAPNYKSYSDVSGSSSGLFAQGEFALRSDLLASAGVRYDYFSKFGGTLNPRLGLIYNPEPQTVYKLLYGRAYRSPNAYEQYLDSPGVTKGNPDLGPETIQTYEAVVERYLGRRYRFSASGYHYHVEDLLSQQYDAVASAQMFRNAGRIRAEGVELEFESRYSRGLLRSSYAWQRAVDERSGLLLNNSPRHMAKLNALLPLFRARLTLGAELQYFSSLHTLAGRETGGFLVVNVTLFTRELARGLELSVAAYNLLDRNYAYPGSTGHRQDVIPQEGRTLRVKVAYKF